MQPRFRLVLEIMILFFLCQISGVCAHTSVHTCKESYLNACLLHYRCKNAYEVYFLKAIIVTNTVSLKRGTVFVRENTRQCRNAHTRGQMSQLRTTLRLGSGGALIH